MGIHLQINAYTVEEDKVYYHTTETGRRVPILSIGTDSYIRDADLECELDDKFLCNLQIGRYTSIANNVKFVIDNDHDMYRPCQGRIRGPERMQPKPVKRNGQLIIMNDCWICEGATLLGGIIIGNGAVVAAKAVVTKDVPPYAIVAGNPAKIIGYRFDEERVEKLLQIAWWNWDHEMVVARQKDLYGDVDELISKYDIEEPVLNTIEINPIPKSNNGEEKIIAYFPDFEQDYSTVVDVIDNFVNTYNNTNYELLICLKENNERQLAVLDSIFNQYAEDNCYVNLYIGEIQDKRALFSMVDGFVTNRNLETMENVELAQKYGVKIYMGVNTPIFRD